MRILWIFLIATSAINSMENGDSGFTPTFGTQRKAVIARVANKTAYRALQCVSAAVLIALLVESLGSTGSASCAMPTTHPTIALQQEALGDGNRHVKIINGANFAASLTGLTAMVFIELARYFFKCCCLTR